VYFPDPILGRDVKPSLPYINNINDNYIKSICNFLPFGKITFDNLDVQYEILIKKKESYEPFQSPIDDILLIKAKLLLIENKMSNAIELIEFILNNYPDDCISPPMSKYFSKELFEKKYITLFTTKNRDYCSVLKGIIYYKQSKFDIAQSLLEKFVTEKINNNDLSEDYMQMLNIFDHPYFKNYNKEFITKKIAENIDLELSETRPDKVAIKILLAIYIYKNEKAKFKKMLNCYKKYFPCSYKFIEKLNMTNNDSAINEYYKNFCDENGINNTIKNYIYND
jgi:hypothetical protein